MRQILCTAALSLLLAACGGGKTKGLEQKPLASFKYVQSSVRPQVFSLDGTGSSVTAGSLATWRWQFGDEAAGAAATELPTATTQHSYQAAGAYTVSLVVIDDKGIESDPVTQMVTVPTVNTEGPKAHITGPSSGAPGASLAFDGSSSTPAGDLTNYAWAYGDGATESGKDKTAVAHTFSAAGSFRVTLTVTDSLGQSDTTEQQVTVGAAGPVAVCSWSPMPAVQGVPVMFSGSASTPLPGSTISVYVWDFGDGVNNIPGMTASHTYNTQATFKPKLKVIDSLNRVNETTCPDVVVGPPSACAGRYSMSSTSMSGSGCLGTFSGNQLTITEMSNGTVTGSEPGPSGTPIPYTGTWSGSAFTLSGTFNDGAADHTITINGTFSGCGSYTASYAETVDFLGTPLTCTYQINGTKL